MALVDLRDRVDEPAVRALVASEGDRARCRAGERILIGWELDGELVGCLGVERDEGSDVVLHSVDVAAAHRGRGIGRAMVDALAEVATAERLVAEPGADCTAFYERCGFTAEPGGPGVRWTRVIDVTPVEDLHALTLADLDRAIRAAWSVETSGDPDEWSEENPARGQCDVTALMVRELLGGEIVIANVIRDGERVDRHAWNRLPSGLILDLTRSQFRRGEQFDEPKAGEPLGVQRAPERYELFASRVRAALAD